MQSRPVRQVGQGGRRGWRTRRLVSLGTPCFSSECKLTRIGRPAVASTSHACECADCHAAAAGMRSPSAHGPLPNGLPTVFLSGAFAAHPGSLQVRPNPAGLPQQPEMLRLPNLSPTSTLPSQLQYTQQPYNPLNFLAPGYLPTPFINNGQINATSFVYAPPPAPAGYVEGGASTVEPTVPSRSRPQLAPIATRPVVQGLPVPRAMPNSAGPSPRRRSHPGDTSPQPSDTSPTTGDSGNEDRIDSPTPFVNKVRLVADRSYVPGLTCPTMLFSKTAALPSVEPGTRLHPVDSRRSLVRVCSELAGPHHCVYTSLPSSQHQLIHSAAQYL